MKYTPSPSFSEAAAYLSSSPSLAKVSNTIKLEVEQLYGLYKYLAVASIPQSSRPSLFDVTGRAKWDAWSSAGKKYATNSAGAERRYLEVARELGWVLGSAVADAPQEEAEAWDDELGVNISLSLTTGKGGMGGSVSAMAPSSGDDAGEQALHGFAIQGKADEVTQFLVENPLVDINQRDKYGYTALHLACDRGNPLAVKVLIQHGADAAIKDPDGLTGLELAQTAGHDEVCAVLQREVN